MQNQYLEYYQEALPHRINELYSKQIYSIALKNSYGELDSANVKENVEVATESFLPTVEENE